MLQPYESYTTENFAQDPWFKEWVLHGNSQARVFWEQWLKDFPAKRQEVIRAKALLEILQTGRHIPDSTEIEESVGKVFEKITDSKRTPNRILAISWLRYAAGIVLISGLIWMGLNYVNVTSPLSEAGTQIKTPTFKKLKNEDSRPKLVILPDGSKVTLNPGSVLEYVTGFEGKERFTRLDGEAFFEVVRNPEKPFLVLTDDLVTRVLGTSFWVNSDHKTKKTIVLVHSGKVSVSMRDSTSQKIHGKQHLVLMPNQQIVFSPEKNEMEKVLPSSPRMLNTPQGGKFIYEDKPIAEVFRDLEAIYGIKISFDERLLANCQITATLGDEPFFEKLDLICKPIRATYQQHNGEVFIDSKGCNY